MIATKPFFDSEIELNFDYSGLDFQGHSSKKFDKNSLDSIYELLNKKSIRESFLGENKEFLQEKSHEDVIKIKEEKKEDKDRLILILYLNVENMESCQAFHLIEEMQQTLKRNFDDSVKTLILPVFGQPTKFESFSYNSLGSIDSVGIQERFNQILREIGNSKNNKNLSAGSIKKEV